MKNAITTATVLCLLVLTVLSSTPGLGAPKPNQREYRPLQAKAVRLVLSGEAKGATNAGAVMTREGWAHFDRQEWEKAMDRFLAALESDPTDASAAEGLTMAVYRSGDRVSAAQLGEEFSTAMPWIRGMIAETLLSDVKSELDRGELDPSRDLVETLPHGGGAYDRVRELVGAFAAETLEIGKTSVAQAAD